MTEKNEVKQKLELAQKEKLENTNLKQLFDRLDKNKDGHIDFKELQEYYNYLNSSKENIEDKDAKRLFETISAANKSKVNIDFNDFLEYVSEKDKRIRLFFNKLDTNKSGTIDKSEIKRGFEDLGIILTDAQITRLLRDLDPNGSLVIDWKDWRDFFRFAPHDKMEELLRYWRVHTLDNDGTDRSIPNDYTKNEKQSGLWWRNLVAGGIAGAVSRSCTAPLERTRIFLQVKGTGNQMSIFGTLSSMIKEGGVRSLWRGNLINILKITPESAVKFGAYEQIKVIMGKDGDQLEPMQRFLAGTAAGWIAQTFIYPAEVLKTRLALRETGQYSSTADCVRKIYQNGGLKAFYRGYPMNCMGIGGIGVNFAIYETLKNKYKDMYPENPQPSVPALILISNTSSSCAMYSTYPLFLITTKMQSSTNPADNPLSLAREVLVKDGMRGFFKGALANLSKVLPSSCISYLTYEYVSKQLGIPDN